jgi:hypothetical protein
MALTGPQNFKEAAKLLDDAKFEKNPAAKTELLARAQVHATLALVAATVYSGSMPAKDVQWWGQNGVKT